MKKLLMMTGAFLMLMTTSALGAVGGDRFVNAIQSEIYDGTRSGQLTIAEARSLRNQLIQYEDQLWEYSNYGNLTRQEERQLLRLEDRIIDNLETLKFNRVTVRSQRNQTRRGGYYYGNNRPGTYYGAASTRRPRNSSTRNRPRTTNRGGTYCPPPRRNR